MQNSRYKTVNTFSRPINANQCIAICLIIGIFVVFFSAVQNNILDQKNRIILISLFCISFALLTISTLASCRIDPVDEIIPIYLSSERSTLAKQIHKCLYCEACLSYVLETSRHCRVCGRCVGGFDHHCIWINNCIGKDNYRWFFIMVFSAVLYLTIFIVTVVILWKEGQWQTFIASMIVSWIFLSISVVLVVPIAVLLGLHCFLSWNGTTTYDFIIDRRQRQAKVRTEQHITHNSTQNAPFSRNNKVGLEVDQIIFQPPVDLQTIEHHNSSQNSQEHEKSVSGAPEKEKQLKQVQSNVTLAKKTMPVSPQIQLAQFYSNHRSLKLIIGNSIEVDEIKPVRRQVSWKRQKKETKLIPIEAFKPNKN